MFSYSTTIKFPLARRQSPKKRPKYGEKKHQQPIQSFLKWVGTVKMALHPPTCAIMLADAAGLDTTTVACDCHAEVLEAKNTVLNTGLYSIIDKLIDKNNIDVSNGFVTHFEVGLSSIAALPTDTLLYKPKARKVVKQGLRDTTNAVFRTFFNGSEANSNSSTVAIGTSTSQFSVLSGTGSLFTIGEMIQVGLPVPEYKQISNIVGDVITLSSPLSTVPTGGQTVKQAYNEVALYGGSTATDALSSGIPFARTATLPPRVKNTGFGMTLEWHITLS